MRDPMIIVAIASLYLLWALLAVKVRREERRLFGRRDEVASLVRRNRQGSRYCTTGGRWDPTGEHEVTYWPGGDR